MMVPLGPWISAAHIMMLNSPSQENNGPIGPMD
jgi:hypothetical protein